MNSGKVLLKLRDRYRSNPSETKFLEFLAAMGEAKVPFKIMRTDYRKVVVEEYKKGIDKDIERVLGKEKADEFREWMEGMKNKYSYSLPQILGEDFSFNLVTLLMVTFFRYIYERFLNEKEKRTPFVKKLLELKVMQYILQEGLWYKKSPSYASRPLSFRSHPGEGRKMGPKIIVTFVKALLDTDFVCGLEENIEKFKNYLDRWLDYASKDEEEREYLRKLEEFFKELINGDFKKWFEKNFNVEIIEGNCLWFKGYRYDTILNSVCNTIPWVTRKIAVMTLKLKMNEDDLFPTLRKEEELKIKEWVKDFYNRKKKK